jgi:hypothetical protein
MTTCLNILQYITSLLQIVDVLGTRAGLRIRTVYTVIFATNLWRLCVYCTHGDNNTCLHGVYVFFSY